MRMIGIIALAMLWPVNSLAQGCEQLLAAGVFDTSINASNTSDQSKAKDWYCSQDFQTSKDAEKLGLGATVPVDGVPIPFSFDQGNDSFRSRQASYCASHSLNSAQSSKTSQFIKVASQTILDAFNRCLATSGLHYQITDMSASDGTVIIAVNFVSPGEPTFAHIKSVKTSSNLSCDASDVVGPDIGGATKYIRCNRTGRNGANITISADYGSGLLTNLRPIPPPYRLEAGTYDFTFCGKGGCAPASRLVAWGPSQGSPTANGWCSLQDMSPYMPAGAILAEGKKINLEPITIRLGRFRRSAPSADSSSKFNCNGVLRNSRRRAKRLGQRRYGYQGHIPIRHSIGPNIRGMSRAGA